MALSWRGVFIGAAILVPALASAADVALVGLFRGKAVLAVDGGAPRTVAIGERTPEGVRLLEISGNTVLVDTDGRKERVVLGQGPVQMGQAQGAEAATLSLIADIRGHYFVDGSINGAPTRFLLDTGASMVSIGRSDAQRAGIDYRRGRAVRTQTANGVATAWQVRLDAVRAGDLTVQGVDALVHENELPFVLLGMSFLNRMDMERQGDRLVLRRRY